LRWSSRKRDKQNRVVNDICLETSKLLNIKNLKDQQASENDQELENNQDKDSSEQSQDPQSE
jgi:hypothetical protein